ncbi:MAG: heavy metal translocating P-type ATPase [Clostridia bacterium]|nr:heavy metal translocating P-type ATPase [Clostridia bacterium]
MEKYDVTGMTCAACAAHVEKAVRGVDGVDDVAVSLLTNSMSVSGSAKSGDIIKAVQSAGYGASPQEKENADSLLADGETPKLRKRLVLSAAFLLVLMYFTMGHTMLGAPLPAFFEKNAFAQGIAQLVLTTIIIIINRRFFISGFRGLVHRAPNMDTLVSLGAGAAYIYGTVTLVSIGRAFLGGNAETAFHHLHNLYFESAGMILTLITVGKLLESVSKGRTTNALKGLMKLKPKTAVIEVDGTEKEVNIDDVKQGDIFVVRAGGSIPVDGEIIDGSGSVDESALTGESIPVDKAPGDKVYAATINKTGFMRCRALKVGEDTTLAGIIRTVSDASATKAPIARIADKVSGVFVPCVMAVALVTAAVWLLLGKDIGFSLARGISVLVISCPCALGLATPVAIMVGNGVGAKNGILFKTAEALETAGKTQIAVLDKTGSVTNGAPVVTDAAVSGKTDENTLLQYAFSLEALSSHPLAKAVNIYCNEKGIAALPVTDFAEKAGNGLSGAIDGVTYYAGSLKYISAVSPVPEEIKERCETLASRGRTPVLVASKEKTLGVLGIADTVKADAKEAVDSLKNMGVRVVMLTGDNARTAQAVADEVGIDEVISGVLPDGKGEVIRALSEQGKTAMVGDGINDAPALTLADSGIAIGAGADIAVDAADIVLIKDGLRFAPAAVRLSRATLRIIHQNLFWAFFYNIICIPLAAGVWIPLTGWSLSPMVGAAAMSLSSFCVVMNALRLNLFNVFDGSKDRKIKPGDYSPVEITETEKTKMTATVLIEGMMCPHCEAHMKQALEALPFVDEAKPSHEAAQAVISLNAPADEEAVKSAVTEAGYVYKGIKEG